MFTRHNSICSIDISIYNNAQKRLALPDFAFHHSKDFIVDNCLEAMYCLRIVCVCVLTEKLFHNFTQRFVKKLYPNKPLRFISRTNLLSCGLLRLFTPQAKLIPFVNDTFSIPFKIFLSINDDFQVS
ncbi:hypothetical protein BpHYR1_043822 [Brachionus plicatilis]|uniref:Uncharacterized protein n=1 Tax=Brachionus plicatilis TaxID=10195 RepID=A0A3M7RWH2_BRAPC|nr:hypothetical protein BpHYR1_043822 [Brachionus plicatilis]